MAKAVKKTSSRKVTKVVMPKAIATEPMMSNPLVTKKASLMSPKVLTIAVVLVAIGLITYKVGPWLVPALVNNTPVTRFQLWSKLEKNYGAQALDDMINEKVLDAAIVKQGIKLEQSAVDSEMAKLEKQFESLGGLDTALTERGLTRTDLDKQIRTQLSVEEILKDKINPTDAEIQADFDAGAKTTYKDKKLEDVKAEITAKLKQSKLSETFVTWFEGVKKDITVKNFSTVTK